MTSGPATAEGALDVADIRDGTVDAAPRPFAAAPARAAGAAPAAPRAGRPRGQLPLGEWARAGAPPLLAVLVALAAWEAWVAWRAVPDYLVPAPTGVAEALREDPRRYFDAARITLLHALGGLALGSGSAFLLAIGMAHSRAVERSIYPLAILLKVTPIVAVAPLVVIWFGFGHWPKIVVAALITFFPMLVNAITGLRSLDPAAHDFMRAMHASRWRVLRSLRLPSSVPYVFAALRISVPLSLIGAVVAEWASADSGMGQVIVIAHGDFDTAGLFAAIVSLAVLGVALTAAVSLAERRLLRWHESRTSV